MAGKDNDFEAQAVQAASRLNLEDQAKVFALLALATAIDNLAAELMYVGNEAHPLHFREA